MPKTPPVKVRMYRQGLGDCFLLTFAGKKRPVHMLIDCGVLLGTPDSKAVMTRVAEDISEETKGRLDVVVATHEHWDHVSGFLQAREVFENKIAMGEIWLAWTEDPNNARANELREERSLRVAALTKALPRWHASGLQPELYEAVSEVLCFFGEPLGAGGNSTKGALECLTSRKDARLRYLTPGGKPIEIPGVEGVRVYVLGPPADDKSLGKLLPRKGSGEAYELRLTPERAFFAALDLADSEAGPRSEEERRLSFPFDEYYRIAKTEADDRTDNFFRHHYYGLDGGDPDPWRRIDEDWLTLTGELALNLDNETNNTCLVLAIEIVETGEVLLFAGDAQIGNWESWKKLSFSTTNGNGEAAVVSSRELLARTVCYKVGHHASHNATHREEGLELMQSPDLVALIPVNHEMAVKKKWNMPFPPLIQRLQEKCRGRVLRMDSPMEESVAAAARALGAEDAQRFKDALSETELYLECRFPL